MNLKIYAFDSIRNYHILQMENVSVMSIPVIIMGVVGVGAVVGVIILFMKKEIIEPIQFEKRIHSL